MTNESHDTIFWLALMFVAIQFLGWATLIKP